MKKILILLLSIYSISLYAYNMKLHNEITIISHVVSPEDIHFYLKDSNGVNFKNFNNLNSYLNTKNKHLNFAMNGGMYLKDLSPQGLYIENGIMVKEIDTIQEAYGNFYMQPNGIFYINNSAEAVVKATKDFIYTKHIKYATQSGPMLIVDGKIHHRFMPNSKNLHIRNGVGVLPDGNLLFAISKEKINFYNFATFFKDRGCSNALYLDGFVSGIYLADINISQKSSTFGVIIAEVKNKKNY